MSDHHEEQIISSASEPVVEIIEEVQEDGSIIRKKKTTRKITKRVLTTTSSVKDDNQQHNHNHNHTTTASASESSESTLKDLSVGSAADSIVTGSSSVTTTTATTTAATATSTAISSTTETAGASSSETAESDEVSEKHSTTTTTDQTKRTFKFDGVFGKGDVESHPFYRFLAKFPLKQSPAPHTRLPPVKPTLYAFAPGWKVGRQDTERQDSKDTETDKKDKETIIGSFDVDSLKWMVSLPDSTKDMRVERKDTKDRYLVRHLLPLELSLGVLEV